MKTPGKNTQIIVSFLMLSLICNLECREMSGPSTNVLKKIEKCDSTEGHTIKIDNYRYNRYNRTVYTYNGNIELQADLRDEDTDMNIMAEKWGNGGWKRSFFRRFPNACSTFEKFTPNYFQSFMKQGNLTGCPVPAGHYVFKDLVINADFTIPILYGLFRAQLDLIKNGTVIFCIISIIDVVPLH
ncbi:uncharacterized protein isoform X4 [Rhodnius prolixus]|uniref:uncharacterized protein isoform X4 n=1 Tax=Rhodnius prolixus TaxID=13249 RepID=UPI003D187A8A